MSKSKHWLDSLIAHEGRGMSRYVRLYRRACVRCKLLWEDFMQQVNAYEWFDPNQRTESNS